jgi:AcrR family transcriptional regulator
MVRLLQPAVWRIGSGSPATRSLSTRSNIDYGIAILNTAGVASTVLRAPRRYRSSQREEQARQTRGRILGAAARQFLTHGYAGTTIREIAAEAGVSVPTVELVFGTKSRVLKAAIDLAIVGDDESLAVLDRDWTEAAMAAPTAEEFLSIVAGVIGAAQVRSSGLVLAVLEGSSSDSELARLSTEMITQRAKTAEWLVEALTRKVRLRQECSKQEAIDTMWILMDPAVFDRLTRHRKWTQEQYQRWFAGSAHRLLASDGRSNGS